MSCANPLCLHSASTAGQPKCHCRCGIPFCSEACFAKAWRMGHKNICREVCQEIDVVEPRTTPVVDSVLLHSDSQVKQLAVKRSSDEDSEFNKYEELSHLGEGGFACVKRVMRKGSEEVFAMKTMSKDLLKKRGMHSQMKVELATHAGLQHPNIICMHTHFEHKGHVHMILELAEGGNLLSHLQSHGPLAEIKAASYFADVVSALVYLHERNIAHRDCKAENVLLCSEDVAKLSDFGWCAEFPGAQKSRTCCGTVDYMSPEVVLGEPHDMGVDVWAVGVLLYVMLVGKMPFSARSLADKFESIRKVQYSVPQVVSSDAKGVIDGLLQRQAADRMPLENALSHNFVSRALDTSSCVVHAATRECSTDGGESLCSSSSFSSWGSGSNPSDQPSSTSVSPLPAADVWKLPAVKPICIGAMDSLPVRTLKQGPVPALSRLADVARLDEVSNPTLFASVDTRPQTARGALETRIFTNLRSSARPALMALAEELETLLAQSSRVESHAVPMTAR